MNEVILMGRMTADPNVNRNGSTPVANFSLAVNRPQKKDGTTEADFPRIVAFGKTAETAEKYLRKGARVNVIGRIQTNSYTNRNGEKVYTTEVVASRLEIIDWPSRDEQQPVQQSQQGQMPPQQANQSAQQAPQTPAQPAPQAIPPQQPQPVQQSAPAPQPAAQPVSQPEWDEVVDDSW